MTDIQIAHSEAASASDKRTTGSYLMTSPLLTFSSNAWSKDTSTPDGSTRAFNVVKTANLTFTVYNVPTITFTLQKNYGWGAANVYANNVLIGTISSGDKVGGGFLSDVTLATNTSGDSPVTIRVTSRSVSAPIVIDKITLGTSAASPEATWNLIPNNMDHKEAAHAVEAQTFVFCTNRSVTERLDAQAFSSVGAPKFAETSEVATAVETTIGAIVRTVAETVAATTRMDASIVTNASFVANANASASQTGKRVLFGSVVEQTDAETSTINKYERWIEELLTAVDNINATARMSVSMVESATAADHSQRAGAKFGDASEIASAVVAVAAIQGVWLTEKATADTQQTTKAGAVSEMVEVSRATDSNTTVAKMSVSVKEAGKASQSYIVSLAASAKVFERCLADATPEYAAQEPVQIITNANPFLTSIPAVFKLVAVRSLDGTEAESTATPRLWGRIEHSSKSNFVGDVFAPPGQRLFPAVDFKKIERY